MTTERSVGGSIPCFASLGDIDWRSVNQNVRRLQVRIVKVVEAGRWGKVKSLATAAHALANGKLLGRAAGN